MHKYLLLTALCFSSLQTAHAEQSKDSYRIYDETTPAHVREFYRKNHTHQTLDFVLRKKEEYASLNKIKMGIWEALEHLDQLVDESDPDLDLPQSYHCFQTAEELRKEGQPRWLILTGFIHDLGKILTLFGEPQWAVVGDTFPVGCAFSDKIVFSEFFKENPDKNHILYGDQYGIYYPNCGFDNLHMSWGHDEYLYQVVKDYLPKEAAYIIRYHSFYPAHREGAYDYFMNDYDREMLPLLAKFSDYDLYSKSPEKLDIEALKPYYEELVAEFLPEKLNW